MTKRRLLLLLLAVVVLAGILRWCVLPPPGVGSLSNVVLTWRSEDTSRTMTVLYQTADDPGVSRVFYGPDSGGGVRENYSFQQDGTRDSFIEVGRTVHTVELSGLKPATTYYFVIADAERARGEEMKFRTLPGDDSAVRIVVGGDMGTTDVASALSRQAAKTNPDLAIVGGDIAYANGDLDNARLWDVWLRNWSRSMVTSDGRRIPLIAAIGNHDVNLKRNQPPVGRAPFFYRYLNQDDSNGTYFARAIGTNTGLIVLDSSHLHKAEGPQQAWLQQQLERYQDRPYRIAAYHRPLYPGGRYPGLEPGESPDLVRAWQPLFDRYRLTLGLEHHYHVHKRTKALFDNKLAEVGRGTVYLGDGAWGKAPRTVVNDLWYLDTAFSRNHVWIVDVTDHGIEYQAIDADGRRFDHGQIGRAASGKVIAD